MRLLASRSSRSSALGPGSPESSRRRLKTHLLTVFGLSPSSLQQVAVGLPVEMMQSAVSRLNPSVYLAAGFDTASSFRRCCIAF